MLVPVTVAAVEDSEALGLRFDLLSEDRCCHSGERRPRAFVRLVTGTTPVSHGPAWGARQETPAARSLGCEPSGL